MSSNELVKIRDDFPINFKPAEVDFEGYDAFKKQVIALHDRLDGYVVTEENLKEAKDTKKALGKATTSINKRRIEITNQLKSPAEDFKDKVDGLLRIMKDSKEKISDQIDVFDKQEKARRHAEKMEIIKKACELAGISPDEIDYQDHWDLKSISKKKFNTELDQQIAEVQERHKSYAENVQVISNTADELHLPVEHWITELDTKPLPEILTAMKNYANDLKEIAQKQKETKLREAKQLEKQGDKFIDKRTGEVKGKVLTLRLKLSGNRWQMEQLKAFLKENAIEYRGI